MPVENDKLIKEVASRYKKIRSGLTIGFNSKEIENTLREARGGVWMSIQGSAELPFESEQFEVVVLETNCVSRDMVREVNRILISGGCMFFSVNERTSEDEPGYTAPELYRLVREGFDILSIRRPKWWLFGFKGHLMTVCARKKAWREHKKFSHERAYLFTPFRSRT